MSSNLERETFCRLEACIAKIRQWMPLNVLKLNDNRTKFMLIQSKHGLRISPTNITIGTDSIGFSESARNIGIFFDKALSLSPHVSGICKATSYQLHKISRIRNLLTREASKTPVHSLITSCLDYCNLVLAGLPDSDIKHLQCI